MRIEPDVGLRELFELLFYPLQLDRPLDRDLGPRIDPGWRSGVRDLRLISDMIGPELDAMLDATGLDECHPHRLVVDAVCVLALAIEHVAHGENGLQSVTLGTAGRRHVGFAARHPDAVVVST